MQPKPIDERHLIDIDIQNRIVGATESIYPLQSPAELEGPQAEIDYDIARGNKASAKRDNSAIGFIERLRRLRAERARRRGELVELRKAGAKSNPDSEKGTHLDVVA